MHQNFGPFNYIFFIIWFAAVGWFIFRVIKFRGLAAAFYGRPISRTVGEVKLTTSKAVSTVVKVHVLQSGVPEKAIGLELVSKTFGGFSMRPMTLSKVGATQLADLLQAAVANAP